jgi:hypothetical protein
VRSPGATAGSQLMSWARGGLQRAGRHSTAPLPGTKRMPDGAAVWELEDEVVEGGCLLLISKLIDY